MDLMQLYAQQAKLEVKISEKHPRQNGEDRLNKKFLALLVELSELANEWRGFKFWSDNQQPRRAKAVECSLCCGTTDMNYEAVQEAAEGNGGHEYIPCEACEATGVERIKNPLLDEYVDCLHFLLSIGFDLHIISDNQARAILDKAKDGLIYDTFESIFLELYELFVEVSWKEMHTYLNAMTMFLGLGMELGFTLEEIEQAYYNKNKVNFERQENGY